MPPSVLAGGSIMMASRSDAVRRLSITEHDICNDTSGEAKWMPTPKRRHKVWSLRSTIISSTATSETPSGSAACEPTSELVPLSVPMNPDIGHHLGQGHVDDIRFGFSAPDDRVSSLNISAEGSFGQKHPSLSFDIEFDQERPDAVTISLLDLDENGFIQAVHRTVRFPAHHLAELLSRRRATAEETSLWQTSESEE